MKNRINIQLLHRYRLVSGYTGTILIFVSMLMLVPLIVGIFNPSEINVAIPVLFNALLLLLLGLILKSWLGAKDLIALDFVESSIVVFCSWMLITLLSSIPYMFTSELKFVQAYFESVSGWTTTGLSMLDLTVTSKMMLFFRAWTQFLGGAGMAIIVIASLTGINANQLYSAEGKGSLIKPNVISSARIVVILYSIYLVYGFIAYLIAGMSCFDALIHCFTAISTGGFANYSSSIGYFDAPGIEIVTITLMILGSMNFVTAYLLSKRKVISVLRNGEIRLFTMLLLIAIPLIFLTTTSVLYTGTSKQLRIAVFEVISALTTTGFSLTSYNDPYWNDSSIIVLTVLMLIGGGACSTAGGIKQYRIYLMLKSLIWQIRKSILPRNAVVKNYIWENEQKDYVSDKKLLSVSNFVFMYLLIFGLGTLVITSTKNPYTGIYYSLRDAMFEFASSLGTVGLSIGITSISTPVHILWIQIIGMMLGRLEFFVIILAVMKMLKDLGRFSKSVF